MSDEKTTKDAVETSAQSEPYPTGNPQPQPTFADFHPQEARALELEKQAAKAEKPAAPATKAEPAAAKTKPEEDEDEDNNRSGKGRK